MRHRIVASVVIAMGVLLSAAAVLAQTAGPSVAPPSPSIIPVTGPSTGPGPLEPIKPELMSVPPGTHAVERGGKVAPRVTGSAQGTRPVKGTLKKPGAKPVVKKAAAPKRSLAGPGPSGTKHVAKSKPRVPAAQTVVGKPLHPAKRPPPAPTGKGAAPVPPVLPRV
jgi:hypothetical protein